MNLPNYVKSKGKLGNYIPVIGNSVSHSFYPFILLSKKIYDDLKKESPSPISIAHLAHEETHFKRQKKDPIIYLFKYFINPNFRFNEELLASIEQMKIYKEHKIKFDLEKRARQLSGPLYLWSNGFNKAKGELEKAWQEI